MASLRFIRGDSAGKNYPLHRGSITIGRGVDCELVLNSISVSRHHARVFFHNGAYFIEDTGSRNGTIVNGAPIKGPCELRHHDKIILCDTVLIFCGDGRENERTGYDDFQAEISDSAASNSSIMMTYDMFQNKVQNVSAEEKLKALIAIGNSLQEAIQLEDVLLKILDTLFEIFPQADRGVIVLRNQKTGALEPKARKLRYGDEDEIHLSRTVLHSVISTGKAVLSTDAANDSRFAMAESISFSPIRSMMCVPLIIRQHEVIGVMQLDASTMAKQFESSDLELLACVAAQAVAAVQNAILMNIAVERAAREQELEIACTVQRGLLPASRPYVAGYEFFDYYAPARLLGGDYYDYILLPNGKTAVVLGDVAGKGIYASLFMAKLATEVKYLMTMYPEPSDAIYELNNQFCDPRWTDNFVTLVAAELDEKTHEVALINAGHVLPVLCHADGSITIIENDDGGTPVGVIQNAEYEVNTIQMEEGDSLFFFTDGATDATNRLSERFGTERIYQCLAHPYRTLEEHGNALVQAIQQFVGDSAKADDLCIAAIRRTARG